MSGSPVWSSVMGFFGGLKEEKGSKAKEVSHVHTIESYVCICCTDLNSLWYDLPDLGWMSRPVIREMRSESGILSSTAWSIFWFLDDSIAPSFSAWGTVRGNPSRMNLYETREDEGEGA